MKRLRVMMTTMMTITITMQRTKRMTRKMKKRTMRTKRNLRMRGEQQQEGSLRGNTSSPF